MNWINSHSELLISSGIVAALVTFFYKQVIRLLQGKLFIKPSLKYTYIRAFGAYQVPMFLDGMLSEYPDASLIILPHQQVLDFWEKWPYKQCNLVQTRAYQDLFEDRFNILTTSTMLLKDAAIHNPVSADFFTTKIDEDIIDQHNPEMDWEGQLGIDLYKLYRKAVPGEFSGEAVEKAVMKASSDVGFLLLFVENYGKSHLENVKVTFEEFHHPKPGHALSEEQLSEPVEIVNTIRNIDSGEKLLLLLEVYYKDEKGYPSSHYASKVVPKKFTFQNSMKKLVIQKPNQDKAAKIIFPFGWVGQ